MPTLLQHLHALLSTVLSYLDVFKHLNVVDWTRGLVASFKPELLPARELVLALPTSLTVVQESTALVEPVKLAEALAWPSANTPALVAEERHPLVDVIKQVYHAWLPRPTHELLTPHLVVIYVSVLALIVGLSRWQYVRPFFIFSGHPKADHAPPTTLTSAVLTPTSPLVVGNHTNNEQSLVLSADLEKSLQDVSAVVNPASTINPPASGSLATPLAADGSSNLGISIDAQAQPNSVDGSPVEDREPSEAAIQVATPDSAIIGVSPAGDQTESEDLGTSGPSDVLASTASDLGVRDDHGGNAHSDTHTSGENTCRVGTALSPVNSSVCCSTLTTPDVNSRSQNLGSSNAVPAVQPILPGDRKRNTVHHQPTVRARRPTLRQAEHSNAASGPSRDLGSPNSADEAVPRSDVAQENFGRWDPPAGYRLVHPVADLTPLIDEEVDDWGWTLIHIALNEEGRFISAEQKVPRRIPQLSDDSATPAKDCMQVPENQEDATLTDHRRRGSAPSRLSVRDKRRTEDSPARHPLRGEDATRWHRLSGQLGLISLDKSIEGFYVTASCRSSLDAEREALKRGARWQRRASSVGPRTPAVLPRGYGLSKHAFLSPITSALALQEMSYATVSRIGVTPSSSPSPASVEAVSVQGSLERTSHTLERTPSYITINRNRGGLDVNQNGAELRAEPSRPALRKRHSLDSGALASPTPRARLSSLPSNIGQNSRVVPGAGPSTVSADQRQGGRARANSLQSNAAASLQAGPSSSQRKRAASQNPTARHAKPLPSPSASPALPSAKVTSTAEHSPSAAGDRSPATPSTSSSTPAPVPTSHVRAGKRRESIASRPPVLETIVGSPTTSPPRGIMATLEAPPLVTPAVTRMIAFTAAYARVDDDDALPSFEREILRA